MTLKTFSPLPSKYRDIVSCETNGY